jgi:hypothetical protein
VHTIDLLVEESVLKDSHLWAEECFWKWNVKNISSQRMAQVRQVESSNDFNINSNQHSTHIA